ncbi:MULTISPECIES: hypothetical protein [unclassified Acinetobacter]|uniref:hypothetical protein n=1 Tax=unclassified Acinetobacter TaxID=196816 RepID=UPI00211F06A1|nr:MULTISPECIES: hypothetical protein [unclassified Acinetobacter]
MKIQFDRLSNISTTDIIELNTHHRVLKHMPLAHGIIFDEARCIAWVNKSINP